LILQSNNSTDYAVELDIFVGKQMLFKVEVTDGSLLLNWHNYAVKRAADDAEVIKQFMVLHKINVYIS
jgi:hypothetical protein